ncbi:uncharacterized protein CCOS01_02748 [Colletotrichum costaricense]|uniref:Uncharacterized protein n=1 Tax=Colletotrichum costaricense TaxID=1209916 RepID=A0AAJ0E6Q4_9PEZI|nr:uncharacterized protein CCOS01_02748 [Colletotrichum costaricense]KAK1537428.1 hypothetical protein CCOS01_02748 [Colletotrichum costaricense]
MPRALNPEPDGTIKPRVPRLLSNSSPSWPRAYLITLPRSAWVDLLALAGERWARFLVRMGWAELRCTLYRATSAMAPTNAPLGIQVEVSVEQIKGNGSRREGRLVKKAPLTPDQAICSRIQQRRQPTSAACTGLFDTLVPIRTPYIPYCFPHNPRTKGTWLDVLDLPG